MAHERIDPWKDVHVMRLSRLGHLKRYRKALSYLEEGASVLDAGCGYGYGSVILARRAEKVLAVDNSREAVSHAKKSNKMNNVKYVRQDLERFSLKKHGKFDAICCFEVMEHLKNPDKVLKKFRNAMKKEGILLISVPNANNAPEDNPYHVQNYTMKEMESLLENNGFRVEKVSYQYPFIGGVEKIARKLTGSSTGTDKRQGTAPAAFDSIPLLSEIFSGIYGSRIFSAGARTLYFAAVLA